MKNTRLLLAGLCLSSGISNAHTLGSVTKSPETSINKFSVTCFPESNVATAKYAFQIKYSSNLPVGLQLTVTKVGAAEGVTVTADRSGVFTPWGFNKAGDGPYELMVTKIKNGDSSAVGKIPFVIEHHCMSANDGHTGTSDTIDISPGGQDGPVDPVNPVDPDTPVQPPRGTPGFSGSLTSQVDMRRYTVNCSARKIKKVESPTNHYRFWIKGATPSSPYHLQMKVHKGDETVEVFDLNSSDKLYSEPGVVTQGDGTYAIEISKFPEEGTTTGNHAFAVKHECLSDTGARTKTSKARKVR